MIDGCTVRSVVTARRCTRERRHVGDHERRSRGGALLESWPRVDGDDGAGAGATYGELLEHLNDLIDLARAEGFGRFVGVLSNARRELARGRGARGARRRRRSGSLFSSPD